MSDILLYLCDGNADGCRKTSCAYIPGNTLRECRHTTQEDHARNGAYHGDPAESDGRFELVREESSFKRIWSEVEK